MATLTVLASTKNETEMQRNKHEKKTEVMFTMDVNEIFDKYYHYSCYHRHSYCYHHFFRKVMIMITIMITHTQSNQKKLNNNTK